MIPRGILVLAFIAFVHASPIENKQLQQEEKISAFAVEDLNYRLNEDVLPIHYKITLEPFFEDEGQNRAFTFKGHVDITLQAQKEVTEIVLHMNDLDVHSYQLNPYEMSQVIPFNKSYYNEQYDKWTIPVPLFEGKLAANQTVILSIDYTGYMRDDMRGFYRSYYMENGKKVWMGTTQFQPVHARRAFPCFDEPGFKSTFEVIMIRPKNLALTIGNTRSTTTTDETKYPGKFIDTFRKTPQMSTYLIAFIVSNYVGSLKNTDDFGVYARPEAKPHTEYAVEFGIQMLDEFNRYFGINYTESIDKMDMAAIPDFSAGAMENWGLLTYRETNILYDSETTPALNQQRIAAVITHEQLHQWFGDLVTCKWWSETWLNEGFARYFQFMGTAFLLKDWDLEEQFVVENHQQSMQLDSTEATHPMTNVVNTKADAAAIFDNISYNKAASILRMLSYYVGKDVFQQILQRHLSDNQYKAVVPEHFFKAIADVKDQATADFFKSWTIQSGFPVVNASLDGNTLKLTQQRFMRNGIANNKTEKYNLPISIAMDNEGFNDTTYKFVIQGTDSYAYNLTSAPKSYYMLNVQQTAFYRVNYVDDNWNKIKEVLMGDDMKKIHVLNRAQVVDDLFNLARGGVVSYSNAVDIIRYLKNETHYIPWLSAINNGLTFLSQRVKAEDAEIFAWFINDLMEKIYKHLTFVYKADDRRTDIYNRVNILSWLCKYGHEDCISESKKAYEDYSITYKKVPKDHRGVVYCNAIRYGGDEEFNFLFEKLLVENVAAEQLNIMNGLACSRNETNIKRLLGRLIRTGDIRIQDRNTVINGVLNGNPEGIDYMFNFITNNYNDWRTAIGDLSALTTTVGRFTSEEQLKKFESFLEAEKEGLGSLHASLTNAVNTAKANLEWDDKYMKEFINHLHEISSASIKVISMIVSALTLFTLYLFN
ncbi:membrane alanyl aminopeptidase [Chironomus tepperi]|uniref:membrane alanyl aminopeptidase n=1 Tax=Chironomus tepperi TaxID=113505 RepID=UPI00391FBD77